MAKVNYLDFMKTCCTQQVETGRA